MIPPIRTITSSDLRNDREKEEAVKSTIESAFNSTEKAKATPRSNNAQRIMIKSFASVISLVASYMSMFYTLSWFNSRLALFQAVCMTIIIVGPIILAPQMVKLAISAGGKQIFASVPALSLVFIVSLSFSMITTIGTLYNNQSSDAIASARNSSNRESVESSIKIQKSRIDRAERTIETAMNDEARYSKSIEQLLDEGVVTGIKMSTLVANRNKAQALRKLSEAELSELVSTLNSYMSTAGSITDSRPDFITWISLRFGANRDFVELLTSAIPAVFVDILSPSMLMVALFL